MREQIFNIEIALGNAEGEGMIQKSEPRGKIDMSMDALAAESEGMIARTAPKRTGRSVYSQVLRPSVEQTRANRMASVESQIIDESVEAIAAEGEGMVYIPPVEIKRTTNLVEASTIQLPSFDAGMAAK